MLQVILVLFCVDYVATDKQHINIPMLLTFAICQILEKQEPVVGQSVTIQDDQIITGFDNSKQNQKQRDPTEKFHPTTKMSWIEVQAHKATTHVVFWVC